VFDLGASANIAAEASVVSRTPHPHLAATTPFSRDRPQVVRIANDVRVRTRAKWVLVPFRDPDTGDRKRHARSLQRVFILWQADDGVQPAAVHVWDGNALIAALGVGHDARGASGSGGLPDLVDGRTKFDLPEPHQML
jgi:hypothetical protein